ncbi:hypothetical protein ABOM_010729 [Aspergillus bombycis]|uniref:NADP-dependent oxidoreductase domain-containing protein n=1 Tax=Aspergillus bombycis TaxID=109264 RepID=A0A1F7ZNA3_9EURO|nr:hypothetical protein ABOM_010729 [Aspergillus bombycis]OGM40608.1 hypothetical protein ABOM_010729 [Aspergillus bombycis]
MAALKPLPPTGFGLLGMTWRPLKTPGEQAFAAMKAAIAGGATLWSSSSIYGMSPEPPTAGLWLLRRCFEKYPEDEPKVTLFMHACFDATAEEHVGKGGVKKIDIFGPTRMDRNIPLEETVGAFKELVDEGQIGFVG